MLEPVALRCRAAGEPALVSLPRRRTSEDRELAGGVQYSSPAQPARTIHTYGVCTTDAKRNSFNTNPTVSLELDSSVGERHSPWHGST